MKIKKANSYEFAGQNFIEKKLTASAVAGAVFLCFACAACTVGLPFSNHHYNLASLNLISLILHKP